MTTTSRTTVRTSTSTSSSDNNNGILFRQFIPHQLPAVTDEICSNEVGSNELEFMTIDKNTVSNGNYSGRSPRVVTSVEESTTTFGMDQGPLVNTTLMAGSHGNYSTSISDDNHLYRDNSDVIPTEVLQEVDRDPLFNSTDHHRLIDDDLPQKLLLSSRPSAITSSGRSAPPVAMEAIKRQLLNRDESLVNLCRLNNCMAGSMEGAATINTNTDRHRRHMNYHNDATPRASGVCSASNRRSPSDSRGSHQTHWFHQTSHGNRKSAWQRVLWKRQDYPDNFMPSERLVSVIMKGPRTRMTYWMLMMRCALISQPIAIVIIFIYINKGLSDTRGTTEIFNSTTIFTIQILIWSFLTFYGVHREWRNRIRNRKSTDLKDQSDSEYNNAKECSNIFSNLGMIVFNALAVLTMYLILYFITVSTNIVRHLSLHMANDSVSNMAGLMLLAHVILTDYSTTSCRNKSAIEGNGLAMNIGIMCGILMASRLEDPWDSFTLLSTSVMLFSLFPMLRSHFLPMNPLGWNVVVTPLLCFVTTLAMRTTNTCNLVVDFIKIMYTLLLFVVPAYYLHLQNRQLAILGPWDIPIIVPSRSTAG